MAVSRIVSAGGANDFNLNITGINTAVVFDSEKSAGSYSIVSSGNDATIDFYAYSADGTLVAYTSTKAFTATANFNKIVVLGGTNGDVLSFTFKTTFTTSLATAEVTAGPYITSLTTTSFPNTTSTAVVTGGNFASGLTAVFTTAATSTVYTAGVTRTNSTTATISRPATFPASGNPYTLTLTNPGVTNPVGSNVNQIAVNAGVVPTWVTGSVLSFTSGSAYNGANLEATDADAGSTFTYSIASGTLPTGLSLASNGVITGTASTSQQTVTFTATDSGGNTVDKAIKFNAKPVWVSSGTLTSAAKDVAYSFTLSTTDDTGTARTFALTSGTLPTGLTLSSAGVISGTPTVYNNSGNTFTITATDGDGGTQVSGTLTLAVLQNVTATFTTTQTWTVPAGVTTVKDLLVVAGGGAGAGNGSANVGSGGGGAGGYREFIGLNYTVTPGAGIVMTIGAGGSGQVTNADASNGYRGGNSSFGGIYSSSGGGGGMSYNPSSNQSSGGSGGGTGNANSSSGGTGNAGGYSPVEGYRGGNGSGQYYAGGGGGASAPGTDATATPNGGAGRTSAIDGVTRGGGGGGSGSTQGTNNGNGSGGSGGGGNAIGGSGTANTGGGGGAAANGGQGGNGGSGIIIVRYLG